MENKNKNEAIENNENIISDEAVTGQAEPMLEEEDEPGVLVLEGENPVDDAAEDNKVRSTTYMPRFTEASEKYRRKGDAKIRERLGIKSVPERAVEENPDEIKLDPTAEFDADFSGVEEAKTPDNVAVDESDESINVLKFKSPEDELEEEAEKEREEIKKLLGTDNKPKADPEPIEEPKEEPVEEEIVEEPAEEKEYSIPDPDEGDFEVFEFSDHELAEKTVKTAPEIADNSKKVKGRSKDKEFSNPTQRDSIKDKFLDSLISIRIRMVASVIFTVLLFALELLSAIGILDFNLFGGSTNYAIVAILDFLLGACVFAMALPEVVKAIKGLFGKKLLPELIPLPLFVVFALYTLTVALSGVTSYALFGLLFAIISLPLLVSSLYRTKADFIAFKMIAQPEDKQVIDLQNTRDLEVENKALDGAVDEYKSKLSRTFTTVFVSDFFKNSEAVSVSPKHFGIIFGVPFGVGLVAGVVAYFLSWSFVTAVAVLALTVMLGCPAFSIIAGKISFFHSQRAALLTDSTAIGEEAYHSFSKTDVFAFDDTDIFGPDDVNLKRFMLYGDRDNMDKVMRQMCALFAAVGGPLDCMFSGIIDNRVRHKTASNIIIEDDGICGEVAGHKICAGSEDYMRRNGIAIPQAAMGRDNAQSLDTIKVMYAAEDGEVNAKFYIRYSFSEEFTSIIPSLRDAGIIPLVYTRDPNVSGELLSTLTAGSTVMRVVKLYGPVEEDFGQSRTSARMITYGDRLDAAGMVVLAKKYHKFSLYLRFTELCAAFIGVALAIALSFIAFMGHGEFTIPMAALWHIITYTVIRMLSKAVFLKDSKKKSQD